MNKLKQTFSRNKDGNDSKDTQEPVDVAGSTGKVAGQGSHFTSAKRMDPGENLGSTVTGEQDQSIGGAPIDPTAAQGTAGPEAGAGSHVNTIDASSAPQNTPATGQTSTYSTHHLGKGDPTSSVVDPRSADPTTYQKPETGATTTGNSGVPSGSAETAAKRAYVGGEGMPGAYPSSDYKNPYLAENLDPRVDGLPLRPKDTSRDTPKTSTLPATAAAGTAFGGAGAASGLTSTANPADRSAEYAEAEKTRIPEPAAASATEKSDNQQSSGFMGKALAAVGLGGAGAGAAAGYGLASRDGKDSAVSDITPSDSTPGVGHSRKESIPTTAYPSGDKSPAPINAPVGGTRAVSSSGGEGAGAALAEHDRHLGRDATLGAASGVAAGGAYAATRDRKEEPFGHTAIHGPDVSSTTHQPPQTASSVQPQAMSPQAATTGLDQQQVDRRDETTAKDDDHKGRNAALAGGAVGAGLVGAGAGAAILEQNKRSEEEAARQRAAADKQRRAAEKDAEKSQKSATKQAEKDEKKHQKEVEKAEKEHQKEVAAIKKQQSREEEVRQKAADNQKAREEEEERKRKGAAAAATAGGAGVAGTSAAYAYEKNKEGSTPASPASRTEEKGKKPGLFKRIFKRRKNKDTGESEDYSSDEEADKDGHHKGAIAGTAAAGTAAAGAGAYGIHEARSKEQDDPSSIGTAHTTDAAQQQPKSSYEAVSGGAVKPSYNPFTKDDPSKQDDLSKTISPTAAASTGPAAATTGTTTDRSAAHDHATHDPSAATTTTAAAAATTAAASSTGTTGEQTHPPALGTTSTAEHPEQITTNPVAAKTAAATLDSHEQKPDLPIEPTLGLPYDPSKDPEAAKRLDEQSEMHLREEKSRGGVGGGEVPTTGRTTTTGWTPGYNEGDNERDNEHRRGRGDGEEGEEEEEEIGSPSSPGGDGSSGAKKGFRQKLKEAITGHKEEETHEHQGEHGVLHKKPHQLPGEVRGSSEAAR